MWFYHLVWIVVQGIINALCNFCRFFFVKSTKFIIFVALSTKSKKPTSPHPSCNQFAWPMPGAVIQPPNLGSTMLGSSPLPFKIKSSVLTAAPWLPASHMSKGEPIGFNAATMFNGLLWRSWNCIYRPEGAVATGKKKRWLFSYSCSVTMGFVQLW